MKDRTTFVIAHRLSTVRHANTIVVLHDGAIAEIGRHQELLAREGVYSRLYKIQFKGKNRDILTRQSRPTHALAIQICLCLFLAVFCLGLLGCTGLFLIVELFDRMDDFIERQVFWVDAVYYLFLKLPGLVYQIVPAIFLLASVLTFSTLTKHNEITAMRSRVLPRYVLPGPSFSWGMGCLLLLVAQEYFFPYANHAYRLFWHTRIRRETVAMPLGVVKQGRIWYRTASRLWSVELGLPAENRLLGVTIYALDETGAIRQRYDAEALDAAGMVVPPGSAAHLWGRWGLCGTARVFRPAAVDFSENLVDMSTVQKMPEEMGLRELLTYATNMQRRGEPARGYLVEFHGKLAFAALVCRHGRVWGAVSAAFEPQWGNRPRRGLDVVVRI